MLKTDPTVKVGKLLRFEIEIDSMSIPITNFNIFLSFGFDVYF